jgi:sorting nexin-8
VFEICKDAEQTEEMEISLGQLGKVVRSASGVSAAEVEQIINLSCSSTSSHCSKEEYATALVLIAQRQAGEELDISKAKEALSNDRNSSLPVPNLDLTKLRASTFVFMSNTTDTKRATKMSTSSSVSSTMDPWAASRDPTSAAGRSALDGMPTSTAIGRSSTLRALDEQAETSQPHSQRPKSPLFSPVYVNPNPTSVHLLPNLGGFLFFRHVLYLVKTPNCAGVKRRYSDFVQLHDYLLARFPFRLIPPLPPKRLSLPHMNRTQAVGSNQQDTFLEQRRLALARYTRSVMSHPVLRKDAVVVSFFTSGAISGSTGTSVRRRNEEPRDSTKKEDNSSSWTGVQAEGAIVEEGLDDSWKLSDSDTMHIPVDMEEKLQKTRELAQAVLERWNSVVSVFERQVRRTEAMSAESTRLSLALSSLLEVEGQTYQGGVDRMDDADAETSTASEVDRTYEPFRRSTSLLISNSQDYADLSTARFHALQHTLDALKNGRDVWLALREMFKRHEKLGRDPIPDLEARIEATRKRFKTTQDDKKPGWQDQCAKHKMDIEKDQRAISRFRRRNQRVRVAVWNEIARMQTLKSHILLDWRAYAKKEAIHLAATKQAAEELSIALEQL